MKKFFVTLAASLILLTASVEAVNVDYLLNGAPLRPTMTGIKSCDEIVKVTLAQITDNFMTPAEKVRACYDWLTQNCLYDVNRFELDAPDFTTDLWRINQGAFKAYGMLTGRAGVSDDYACAFAALTRAIGLNCYTVTGKDNRVWCVIKIDGVEYIFDPQRDDGRKYFCVPVNEAPDYAGGSVKVKYFRPLVTD